MLAPRVMKLVPRPAICSQTSPRVRLVGPSPVRLVKRNTGVPAYAGPRKEAKGGSAGPHKGAGPVKGTDDPYHNIELVVQMNLHLATPEDIRWEPRILTIQERGHGAFVSITLSDLTYDGLRKAIAETASLDGPHAVHQIRRCMTDPHGKNRFGRVKEDMDVRLLKDEDLLEWSRGTDAHGEDWSPWWGGGKASRN